MKDFFCQIHRCNASECGCLETMTTCDCGNKLKPTDKDGMCFECRRDREESEKASEEAYEKYIMSLYENEDHTEELTNA